jgi:class 3 adenylate cyclase/tetratricopeptide (TPR) repeat protein
MKCPKCEFENLEGMNFCGKCAAKLEKICPQCNFSNPPEYEFCGKCGNDLAVPREPIPQALSFEEKLDKIQRYLPGGLTEKILAQRGKIEGERKQVTVMFCDMEGFTPLSERLEPEEVYSIVDEVFEILIHRVHEYGGTVNEMTGDGIMALFGAPIAVEDAPQRAIRSALSIHREMTRFSDRMKSERGIAPIKMRIGIHTGPVVVGTLGNDLRLEFTAVGDTVNLASRMEGLAEPGTTYVTEDTCKLTEGLFRFEALGERQVKGKEAPVRAYRVIVPSTRRTRFDVSAERGLTPFVGRERELELLLDGFERAKGGRGQAFSIMGEAGVGKSRLLYEFRKAIGSEDVTFLEGKCLSYSRGVAYHPVIDILKSNFDVREDDEDYQVRGRVKGGLKAMGVDEATTLPYLLELLGVEDSGIDQIPMSPEARKDRTMEAIKRIALKGSELRPLILAIEDLHWMDRSSEEVIKNLLESISGAKVLSILTYRPEFVPTWGGKSYHSQVTLNRLSNRESLAMVTYILGTEEIERALEELVLEKTEGIPFFIEEFIKSLKDLGIIERRDGAYCLAKDIRDVTIPSTIQDVIMARVDSLPDAAKGVLQTGSVIEREFSHELIKRVTGISQDELLSHLSVLKDSELLYERGIYPESSYIFRHALTREVVYDSILTARRKRLHVEIGDAIEEMCKDDLNEHYEALAEHYVTGENHEKGAEYCRLAARKAERAGSLTDAIAYAEKRVACLERLSRTEEVEKKIVDARTALGLYLIQINYHVEAKEAVDPIVDLALQRDYKRRVSQIYTIIGSYNYMVEEDFPNAFKWLEEGLQIAEELGDILSLVMANHWLGLALQYASEFEKALYHWEKVVESNVAANTLWGISVAKSHIGAWIYGPQGRIDLAYQTTNEAVRMAEESGDIYSKAQAYADHGVSCYYKGFLRDAEQHLLKAIDLCERINLFGYGAFAHHFLGHTYFAMEEYQTAQDHFGKAISLRERARLMPSFGSLSKIASAGAKVMSNEKDINLNELFRCYDDNKIKAFEGQMLRYIGEILLNIDDQHMNKAEDWIKKAIEANKRNGMMWYLGRDYASYAELLKRKGDLAQARENLNTAIEILKECGADGWVKRYEEELAKI